MCWWNEQLKNSIKRRLLYKEWQSFGNLKSKKIYLVKRKKDKRESCSCSKIVKSKKIADQLDHNKSAALSRFFLLECCAFMVKNGSMEGVKEKLWN